MITNINYNHLYYFWQVSKHGSIAAASKILNLTPQTVSSQITNLEQRLGKPLFVSTSEAFGHPYFLIEAQTGPTWALITSQTKNIRAQWHH